MNKDELNFGIIKPGEKKTLKIKVENIGGAELVIEDIKAECGCTNVKIEKKTLQPQESTTMKITYTAETRLIDHEELIEKFLVIKSNSINRIEEYSLKGIVKPVSTN